MRYFLSNLLLILFLQYSSGQNDFSDNTVVIKVNDDIVTKAEWEIIENNCKPQIIKEFKNKNIKFDSDFWSRTDIIPSPSEVLRLTTQQKIIEVKVQQQFAKKNGLIDSMKSRDFMEMYKQENERRIKAINRNEIIYGPRQYKVEGYFDYLLANLIIKNKRYLVENILNISDNKLYSIYQQNKDSLYVEDDFFQVLQLTINTINSDRNGVDKNFNLKKIVRKIEKSLRNGNFDLTKLKKNNQLKIEKDTLTFDPKQHESEEGESRYKFETLISDMKTGNDIKIFEDKSGGYKIYKLLQFRKGDYIEFQRVKNGITRIEVDRLYMDYVQELVQKSVIVLF